VYKFLFIDCTIEPNGPGLPTVIESSDLADACEKASIQTTPGRSLKVYQMPTSEGLARFITLHTSGEPPLAYMIEAWRKQNLTQKVARVPRA